VILPEQRLSTKRSLRAMPLSGARQCHRNDYFFSAFSKVIIVYFFKQKSIFKNNV